jgi:23S rRNA (uracil1939-C5)-methyltransferase
MQPIKAIITALTHDARGITHINGKATFIEGALPGEEVLFSYTKQRGKYDEGKIIEIIKAAPERVEPRCQHFGICGGCAMQHINHSTQLELKQKILLEQLKHLGGVEPETLLTPLTGPIWGYRRKARLGVREIPQLHGHSYQA